MILDGETNSIGNLRNVIRVSDEGKRGTKTSFRLRRMDGMRAGLVDLILKITELIIEKENKT